MSTKSVSDAIVRATQDQVPNFDGYVDGSEAMDVVRAAMYTPSGQKSPVSEGETKLIVDLFNSRASWRLPHMVGDRVLFDEAAESTLKAFCIQFAQPKIIKDILLDTVATLDRGAPLTHRPDVSKLLFVPLRNPSPAWGEVLGAYVDLESEQFYLQSIEMPGDGPDIAMENFYGLFDLIQPEIVTVQTREKLQRALDYVKNSDHAQFVTTLPDGISFVSVPLERQPPFMADGFEWDAFLPTGPVHPSAPKQDPNEADYVYLCGTGGRMARVRYYRVSL